METMRYREEKKSHKGAIFAIFLFILIGSAIIIFAIKNEKDPEVIGQTASDVQSLVDVDNAQSKVTPEDLKKMTYKVENKDLSDNSNPKFKGNIKIPVVTINDKKLDDINSEIEKNYSDLFSKLKNENKNSEHKFTYTVSYNTHDNMIGSYRILSITLYERIVDNENGDTTYDKVTSYNIDFKDGKKLTGNDVIVDALGSDAKNKIKDQIKNYVVSKGYMKQADYTYAYTGLESFYFDDNGSFHIIFNKGDLVNKYIDITINK